MRLPLPLSSPRKMAGFNLVELSIALVIIGFLLGGGLMALQAQSEIQQTRDTQRIMEDAREALIGFTATSFAFDSHPFLPCPDKTAGGGAGTPNDGVEDRLPAGGCVTPEGNLPWVTLGLSDNTDPWGRRIRYHVTPAFSNSTTGIALTSLGDMTVLDAAAGATIATTIPALLLSHGRNGRGGITPTGATVPTAGSGADELANTDGNLIFVSHPKTEAGAAGGEFDDQVVWLTPNILFNRLIQAGRLP
ncbi:MAG: prepilin-type N-terminal cleavage/methylation protein [Rhodocyclaceae bacterium]|nr:prepilin-type N-terminal cleavage/methylation protein [Rhodocyclaceae bacterium]